MRHTFFTLCVALSSVLLCQSCFKDEPLNVECDIHSAWVHVDNPQDIFVQLTDTVVDVMSTTTDIVFSVRAGSDLTAMAPRFNLTPGAIITPANGSVHDFSAQAVAYTVTSQDGSWQRTYHVSFKQRPSYNIVDHAVHFDFENCFLNAEQQYYEWTDYDTDNGPINNWASANPAYLITKSTARPDEYPTVPCEGFRGKGVMLETKSTGEFGAYVDRRLAAGNFFIGSFDVSNALVATMKCTRFGLPFAHKPVRFSGYYKYLPGPSVTDHNGTVLPDAVDRGTIYAVLYRNHDSQGKAIVLYGDDVQNSPNLVAEARLNISERVDEWTPFSMDFEYYEEIDPVLLADYGYSFAIVSSSSIDGNLYLGAVGSRLFIDEFCITLADTPSAGN